MRILITGMAGFIGYHCAEALLDQGHTIFGIDNLNDYYDPRLKEARLERLLARGAEFERCELADSEHVSQVFARFLPQRVLHLAAQAGVRYSIDHPETYVQSNLTGTLSILEACRHHGKPRLVYASSSSVYGGNTKLPFAESDRVDHPTSLYAATKKANELMAHTYGHLFDVQTVGLRFFTVYGPWGRPDMAMWLFADAIQQQKPIKVFNHGDMFRDFTYIDDIVAGVCACLLTEGLDRTQVFNLGNHRSENLMDLIGLIEKNMGRTAEKRMLPMQDGDVKATYAEIDLAREKLGFEPTTSIHEGVPKFIEWFMAHPQFHSSVSLPPEVTAPKS